LRGTTATKEILGTGTFLEGYQHRFYGSAIVFFGADNAVAEAGYYFVPAAGGTITRLVDENTQKPDRTGKFGATAFSGAPFNLDHNNEVFSSNWSVFAVPVSATPLTEPATGTRFFICEANYITGGMGLFAYPDLSGATMALFAGNVNGEGAIYYAPLSGFAGVRDRCAFSLLKVTNATRVASLNTRVPADPRGRKFDPGAFTAPAIDGADIVFGGAAPPIYPGATYDLAGVYGYNQTTRATVKLVDTRTPVPGGTGNFGLIGGGISISDGWTLSAGNLVFLGVDAKGVEGLYLVPAGGGKITKILATGDTLPHGRVVGDKGALFFQPPIQPDSLHGRSLAVRVDFTDPVLGGGNGIYLVTW
jgi:hypothetical protein